MEIDMTLTPNKVLIGGIVGLAVAAALLLFTLLIIDRQIVRVTVPAHGLAPVQMEHYTPTVRI